MRLAMTVQGPEGRCGGAARASGQAVRGPMRPAPPRPPHQQLVRYLAQRRERLVLRQLRRLGHPVQQPRVQPLCGRKHAGRSAERAAARFAPAQPASSGHRLPGIAVAAAVQQAVPGTRGPFRLTPPPTCDKAVVRPQHEAVQKSHHARRHAPRRRGVQVPQSARLLWCGGDTGRHGAGAGHQSAAACTCCGLRTNTNHRDTPSPATLVPLSPTGPQREPQADV